MLEVIGLWIAGIVMLIIGLYFTLGTVMPIVMSIVGFGHFKWNEIVWMTICGLLACVFLYFGWNILPFTIIVLT